MSDSFTVIESTPGYLPDDDDPPTFEDYATAVEYLNERAAEYADDPDGNYRVEYGIASGDNLAAVIVWDDDKVHDLGRVIEIVRDEPDDDDDDDDTPCYHVNGGEVTADGFTCDDCGSFIRNGAVVEGEAPGTIRRPVTARTTFGTVRRDSGSTEVSATGAELRDWANRGDCRWPCSTLATLDSVTARFDSAGDLVAIEGDERADLACDELDAWSSEVLVRAGFPNHPAIRGGTDDDDAPTASKADRFGIERARALLEGTVGYETRHETR